MNPDFRRRVFLPVILPLGVTLGLFVFAFSLSRILLTVSEAMSVVLAIAVAGYVLFVASYVASRPRISARALGIGLAIGLLGLTVAGAVAGAAGMRELHEEDTGEEGGVAAGEHEGDSAAEVPDDAVLFVSEDIAFTEAPTEVPAGTVTFALENAGAIVHNVTIEELSNEVVVEAEGGESATATTTLEAGETYTYYCSIPGHRAAMNGEFTVTG